jgi:hypothetical protein
MALAMPTPAPAGATEQSLEDLVPIAALELGERRPTSDAQPRRTWLLVVAAVPLCAAALLTGHRAPSDPRSRPVAEALTASVPASPSRQVVRTEVRPRLTARAQRHTRKRAKRARSSTRAARSPQATPESVTATTTPADRPTTRAPVQVPQAPQVAACEFEPSCGGAP